MRSLERKKQGFYTVMIDNEQAYSPVFAQTLGVDPDRLIYLAPDTLEECFEAIENSIKAIREHDTETPILIGYDSIGVSPV
jgi:RecA/RadA recombinase